MSRFRKICLEFNECITQFIQTKAKKWSSNFSFRFPKPPAPPDTIKMVFLWSFFCLPAMVRNYFKAHKGLS